MFQVHEIKDISARDYIYYCLLPHSYDSGDKGRRPLTMSLMQQSPKSMEVMLGMLMMDPEQDYFRYIEPRLFKFFETKSSVFFKFLDQSCRKFQFRKI
jgi:hypothetical protein